MESLIAPLFNFFLLTFFLVYKLYKPSQVFLIQRRKKIHDDLQTIRAQLNLAQERYEEFSSKLKAIDAEILTLREQTRQDASMMKQKILAEAKRLSQTLLSDASRTSETLFLDFKSQLSADFGVRVIDRAEELLKQRLTSADQTRIQSEFSSQMERSEV